MHGGRLTDRHGGGPVVLAGLAILLAGTIPFTLVGATTPYWLLAIAVGVRGVGLGFSMMPAMAAAYATLDTAQVPRATPMLNVAQRVGGSLGTAILAVVLQQQLDSSLTGSGGAALEGARSLPPDVRARAAEPIASAFAHTYWWSFALTAVALIPAGSSRSPSAAGLVPAPPPPRPRRSPADPSDPPPRRRPLRVMGDPCVSFAALHDAMRAAGVDVLVRRGREGALSVSLVDHGRCRSLAVPVPPRGFDAAATVLCCSLALAAAPLRREWPELAALAWARV